MAATTCKKMRNSHSGSPDSVPEQNRLLPPDPIAPANDSIRPIDEIVRHIVARSHGTDDTTLQLASDIVEIKRRVSAGELGLTIKWMEWAMENIGLSSARIYELVRVGGAKDPRAELELMRREVRERKKRMNETAAQKASAERARGRLAYFARHGPIEQVVMLDNQRVRMPKLI